VAGRAIVVDDHPAFRASARRLLEVSGFDVVAEAGNGSSALELTRELEPDVLLLDLVLPDMSGLDVAEQLRGETAVVLVSSRDPGDLSRRVERSGIRAFIPKDRLTEQSLRAAVEGRP
jgi:DNA-binding NarL/FixJ family response regulator